MRFKNKALGLIAAAALSLTAVSGAMADDVGTQVDFQKNPNGVCTANITNNAGDYGALVWDGTSWTWPRGYMSLHTETSQTVVPNDVYSEAECSLLISGTGMTNGTYTIPAENVLFSNSRYGTYQSLSATDQTLKSNLTQSGNDHWFEINTSGLTIGTGEYTGSITITASAGS